MLAAFDSDDSKDARFLDQVNKIIGALLPSAIASL
jgi:hypothetical protein